MRIIITVSGSSQIMTVIEDKVTCTLTLGKTHDIITKGEDSKDLANRISRSYRDLAGKGFWGVDYLESIKRDLMDKYKEQTND